MKKRKRNGWPLINPMCRDLDCHMIVFAGLPLCCLTDYRADEKREPRSYTLRSVA